MIVIQMGATAMRCGDEPSLLSALLPLLTGDRRPACSGHNLTRDAAQRTLFVCVLSIRLAVLLREAALWPLRLVKRPDENEQGAGATRCCSTHRKCAKEVVRLRVVMAGSGGRRPWGRVQ